MVWLHAKSHTATSFIPVRRVVFMILVGFFWLFNQYEFVPQLSYRPVLKIHALCTRCPCKISSFFFFFTTESEEEWVDYWFDGTNWSFCKHALQNRLWRQIRSRATPLLNLSWTKDAWFFESFQVYKMAGFVKRRKKWPLCVSNGCKDSFERKKYFGVRGTLYGTASSTYLLFVWMYTVPCQDKYWLSACVCVFLFYIQVTSVTQQHWQAWLCV